LYTIGALLACAGAVGTAQMMRVQQNAAQAALVSMQALKSINLVPLPTLRIAGEIPEPPADAPSEALFNSLNEAGALVMVVRRPG
jgi:hypothetical protein